MELSWFLRMYDLFIVLVLVMTGSCEPLTGANVCYHLENYTLTITETYEEPVEIMTSSWCFSIPPRCWRSRTEMRTRYRIKEEIRQRNVSECCEGYTLQKLTIDGEIIDKCAVIYDCKPGYIGKNCNIECPEGFWGILCMHSCECPGNSVCNGQNGSCQCASGWQGPNCTEICDNGKYGEACSLNCSCTASNVTCHHVTGSCPNNTESIDLLSVINNSPNNSIHRISPTIYPSSPSSSATASDSSSSLHESTIIGDNHDNRETSINSRNSEIILDSTLETTVITEYHGVNLQKVDYSTIRPIVAVVRVAGKASSKREKMIIAPEIDLGHVPGQAVPFSLDVAVIVVIGSIISLALTTLAVFAILHVRSKLFETIRLSIYDPEKPDTGSATLPRGKTNGEIQTIRRNSAAITSLDYETPRCIIPERFGTLPRPNNPTITRESTYSNQYPNIQLFANIRELMEAHYDRPPATNTFRQPPTDSEPEHLYDEIPLQSTKNLDEKAPKIIITKE